MKYVFLLLPISSVIDICVCNLTEHGESRSAWVCVLQHPSMYATLDQTWHMLGDRDMRGRVNFKSGCVLHLWPRMCAVVYTAPFLVFMLARRRAVVQLGGPLGSVSTQRQKAFRDGHDAPKESAKRKKHLDIHPWPTLLAFGCIWRAAFCGCPSFAVLKTATNGQWH